MRKTAFDKVTGWNKSPNDTEAGTVGKNTCTPSYESLLCLQSAQTVEQRAVDHKMKLTNVNGIRFVSYLLGYK